MISNGALPSTFPIHFLIFWLQFFHLSSLFFPYFWFFKITIGMKLFYDTAEGICTKDLGVESEDYTNWATTTAPHFFYLFLKHFFQWVSKYFSLFFFSSTLQVCSIYLQSTFSLLFTGVCLLVILSLHLHIFRSLFLWSFTFSPICSLWLKNKFFNYNSLSLHSFCHLLL